MNALSNAGMVENQSIGFEPSAFPKAVSSRTGVSVDYIHDESGKRKWFVFRVSYGRVSIVADYLIRNGIYTYSPKIKKVIRMPHSIKTIVADLLPNFLFCYLTDGEAKLLVKGAQLRSATCNSSEAIQISEIVSYYYNHCYTDSFGKNPPLTIADPEMESFIIATSTHDEHVICLKGKAFSLKSQDEVKVVFGKFKGVCGRVIRVERQQRILIELKGFNSFATAYVPTAFIQKQPSK